MSQKSSVNRILTILKTLNDGKIVNISNAAYDFNVSERTIRRDFDVIKNVYPDFLIKKGENYSAINKNILEDILTGSDLATLISIIRIFEQSGTKIKLNKELQKLHTKSQIIYRLDSKPFESLTNNINVSKLEQAIEYKQVIEVQYKTNTGTINFKTKPYKIILLNENFYIACENIDEHKLELFRVNLIEDIQLLPNTFYYYPKLELFIPSIQTPWATFNQEEEKIKVIFEAEFEIAKYFKMKKYMHSQKITEVKDNGNILLEYVVSNINEITELAIKWLPKIKVIEPTALIYKLKIELIKKLEKL